MLEQFLPALPFLFRINLPPTHDAPPDGIGAGLALGLLELAERFGQSGTPVDDLRPLPGLELGMRRRVEGRALGGDGAAGAPSALLGATYRGLPGGSVGCGHGLLSTSSYK